MEANGNEENKKVDATSVSTSTRSHRMPSMAKLIPILALVLVVFGVVLGVAILGSNAVFDDREKKTEELYSVEVPSGWSRDDSEDNTVAFYSGEKLDSSDHAIIVSQEKQAYAEYPQLSDEEKDTAIEFLAGSFNTEFSEQAAAGFSFQSVDAVVASHPEADRAVSVRLEGKDENDVAYKGKGLFMLTSDGSIYLVLVAAPQSVFEAESQAIDSILGTFDIL